MLNGKVACGMNDTENMKGISGKKTAGDVMQFLRFTEDGDGVKVIASWIK